MSYRLKLRLSRPYDYDLYCLYLSIGKKQFAKTTKNILASYIKKEEITIPIIEEWQIPVSGDKGIAVTCNLSLKETDEEIMTLLEKIPDRKRASFVKTLIRIFYAEQLLNVYYSEVKAEAAKIPKRNTKTIEKEKFKNEPSSFSEKTEKEPQYASQESNEEIAVDEGPNFDLIGDFFGGIKEQ